MLEYKDIKAKVVTDNVPEKANDLLKKQKKEKPIFKINEKHLKLILLKSNKQKHLEKIQKILNNSCCCKSKIIKGIIEKK